MSISFRVILRGKKEDERVLNTQTPLPTLELIQSIIHHHHHHQLPAFAFTYTFCISYIVPLRPSSLILISFLFFILCCYSRSCPLFFPIHDSAYRHYHDLPDKFPFAFQAYPRPGGLPLTFASSPYLLLLLLGRPSLTRSCLTLLLVNPSVP
jgi:hypothetical protein